MEAIGYPEGLVVVTDLDFSMPDEYVCGAVLQIACVKCGGVEFNVGSGEYLTAIRCTKCGVPCSIHQG